LIRTSPDDLPAGEFSLNPSFPVSRFIHTEVSPVSAELPYEIEGLEAPFEASSLFNRVFKTERECFQIISEKTAERTASSGRNLVCLNIEIPLRMYHHIVCE